MKIPKSERIKEIVRLFSYGYKVRDIAKLLEVSESTIYKNYQEFRLNNDFVVKDILYHINKIDVKKGLNSLSYSDICLLAKKFKCGYWIKNKIGKIEKLIPFLSLFFYFELNPLNCNRDSIKRAYYKKAKQLHPDLTKMNTNKEFCDMKVMYNVLIKTVNLM